MGAWLCVQEMEKPINEIKKVANDINGGLSAVKNFLGSISLQHERRRLLEHDPSVPLHRQQERRRRLLEDDPAGPRPENVVEAHLHRMHRRAHLTVMEAHAEGMRKFVEMNPQAFDPMTLV